MNARLTILAAMLGGIVLGLPTGHSGEFQPSTKVYVTFGTDKDELVAYPREVKLEAGQVYQFIVINPSEYNHIVAAPELATDVLTTELHKAPMGSELSTRVLESGILLRPGQTIHWSFMPTKAGSYKLGCEDAMHAAAGMHTMIKVAL